jgi:hypothetical protein
MELNHPTPTAGRIIKKLIQINPELTTAELIVIIKQSTSPLGQRAGEFARVEVINEELAVKLARESLLQSK